MIGFRTAGHKEGEALSREETDAYFSRLEFRILYPDELIQTGEKEDYGNRPTSRIVIAQRVY